MSKSFRKPYWTEGYGGKSRGWYKKYANTKVRRSNDVPNGKVYKKFFCSWSICDWKSHCPEDIKAYRK